MNDSFYGKPGGTLYEMVPPVNTRPAYFTVDVQMDYLVTGVGVEYGAANSTSLLNLSNYTYQGATTHRFPVGEVKQLELHHGVWSYASPSPIITQIKVRKTDGTVVTLGDTFYHMPGTSGVTTVNVPELSEIQGVKAYSQDWRLSSLKLVYGLKDDGRPYQGMAGGTRFDMMVPAGATITDLVVRKHRGTLTGIGLQYIPAGRTAAASTRAVTYTDPLTGAEDHVIPFDRIRKLTLYHGPSGRVEQIDVENRDGSYRGVSSSVSSTNRTTTSIFLRQFSTLRAISAMTSQDKLYSMKFVYDPQGDLDSYRGMPGGSPVEVNSLDGAKVTNLLIRKNGDTLSGVGLQYIPAGLTEASAYTDLTYNKWGGANYSFPIDQIRKVVLYHGPSGRVEQIDVENKDGTKGSVYSGVQSPDRRITVITIPQFAEIRAICAMADQDKLYSLKFVFGNGDDGTQRLETQHRKDYMSVAVSNKRSTVAKAKNAVLEYNNRQIDGINARYQPEIDYYQSLIADYQQKMHEYYIAAYFTPPLIGIYYHYSDLKTAAEATRNAVINLKNDYTKEYNDRNALLATELDLARLHAVVPSGDEANVYEAALRADSLQLADLQEAEGFYAKDAADQEQAYKEAVAEWKRLNSADALVESVLAHLPVVGHEIENIYEYSRHPSNKNLEKMLLGFAGPLVESIGTTVIQIEDPSDPSGEMIRTVIEDLTASGDAQTKLSALMNDIAKDISIMAVDGARELGLYQEKPGDVQIFNSDFVNISDMKVQLQKETDPARLAAMLGAVSQLSAGQTEKIDNIFTFAFGSKYHELSGRSRDQVRSDLFEALTSEFLKDMRTPRWTDTETLNGVPAAFVYNDQECIILLNRDILKDEANIQHFYLEELGHFLNWARGWLYQKSNLVSSTEAGGDEGARFRDAIVMDDPEHAIGVKGLPIHARDEEKLMFFKNGKSAHVESYSDIWVPNDHLAGGSNSKLSMLFRVSAAIPTEIQGGQSEISADCVVVFGQMMAKNMPYTKVADAPAGTEGVPTMYLNFAFRDLLKFSLDKASGGQFPVNFSPRLVRKHGFSIPFQMFSEGKWTSLPDSFRYVKSVGAGAEFSSDLYKLFQQHTNLGDKLKSKMKTLGDVPSLALHAKGALQGEFKWSWSGDDPGWKAAMAADIVTSAVGGILGAIGGVATDTDPVALSELGSQVLEAVIADPLESTGILGSPDIYFDLATWVALPLSIEGKLSPYKASKPAPSSSGPPMATPRSRDVWYSNSSDPNNRVFFGEQQHPRVDVVNSKFKNGWNKLSGKLRQVDAGLVIRPRFEYDFAVAKLRGDDKGEGTLTNNDGD